MPKFQAETLAPCQKFRHKMLFLQPDVLTLRACSSKGRIVILGRIVSASGQIFRSDFRPQDEIFRPGMPFRPLDEQAPRDIAESCRCSYADSS